MGVLDLPLYIKIESGSPRPDLPILLFTGIKPAGVFINADNEGSSSRDGDCQV